MEQNCIMQTATWLVSRELTEAAGPWNPSSWLTMMASILPGIVMHSAKIAFVDRIGVYYRVTPAGG
jgi:hypothetical protein